MSQYQAWATMLGVVISKEIPCVEYAQRDMYRGLMMYTT